MNEPDLERTDDPEARERRSTDEEPLAAAESFPWPPAETEGIVGAFGRTWHGASLAPRRFYAALPERGSLGAAILYYLALGIAVAGATLFWQVLLGPPENGEAGPFASLGIGGRATNPLVDFLLSPALLLLTLFLAAGVTHLLLKLFGGAHRDFAFTTRLFCFAYSPQLLGVIPRIGMVAGFVWMLVVAIIGLREGHRTTTLRAAAAVLLPVAVALFFVALAMLIVASGALVVPPR